MNAGVATHGVKLAVLCLAASLILGVVMANADDAPAVTTPAVAAPAAASTTNAPAAAAPAPTKDWSVTTSQDYFSAYIFRGVAVLKSNPIWSPSVVATYKNLTAYYTGYFGSGSDTVPGNKWYEEDDFAADVHQGLFGDKLTLTAGAYGYLYPDGKSGKDTYEFYGKVAWANYVNPYIALNWDVHAIEGGYGAAGVTHTYDLTQMLKLKEGQSLSIIPSAQLGISFGYTQSDVNFNDVLLGVSIPFNLTPALSVHAQYQCSIAMNSAHAVGAGNYSVANVGITYSF